MIKNIVFDMGKVLIDFAPEIFVKRYEVNEEEAKLLVETVFYSGNWAHIDDGSIDEVRLFELVKEGLASYFNDGSYDSKPDFKADAACSVQSKCSEAGNTSNFRQEKDASVLTNKVESDKISVNSRLLYLFDVAHDLIYNWDKPLMLIEGMEELIAKLKSNGYGIYLLSNASCRQHEYWDRIPASKYFDGTLISADYKLVKPNPEIYMLLFKKFSLVPDECLFIDDVQENIDAAKRLGMSGYVFDGDVKKLSNFLQDLLNLSASGAY